MLVLQLKGSYICVTQGEKRNNKDQNDKDYFTKALQGTKSKGRFLHFGN